MEILKENKGVFHKIMNQYLKLILIALFVSTMTGCGLFSKLFTPDPKPLSLVRLSPDEFPLFSDDMFFDSLDQSILQSLNYYKKMPPDKKFAFGPDLYNAAHLIKTLTEFQRFIETRPSLETLNCFIRDKFAVYKSIGNKEKGEVLFTGYYEPALRGSLEKKGIYQYPVFTRPDDHVEINLRRFSDNKAFKRTIIGRYTENQSIVPYYARSEIGNGDILQDKAKVIAYVDNPIDLFFLEIQGSGIIHLDNGGFIRVHYHTKNGHPYKSIGAYLIRNNSILKEDMSMQKIREYLECNPEKMREIFNYNPSFVFFKTEQGGPYGCYNAEVTSERSIATDKRIFPACALAFIKTQKPVIDGDASISEWIDFGRFVLNQDTGGAIRGAGRADLFKGNGKYAEIAAGHMKHKGLMYFLVLKK